MVSLSIDLRGHRFSVSHLRGARSGKTLWFTPGLGLNPGHYFPFLEKLAERYEVFAADFTSIASLSEIREYTELIEDLKSLLRIRPDAYIGHSLGSIPSLMYAISGAPVVCMNPPVPRKGNDGILKLGFAASSLRLLAHDFFGKSGGDTSRRFALSLMKEAPDLIQHSHRFFQAKGLRQAVEGVFRPGRLEAPVLVLASDQDEYFSPGELAAEFTQAFPRATIQPVSAANHHWLVFDPERAVRAVTEFLDRSAT